MDKNTLRKNVKDIRKTLSLDNISADLASQIRHSDIFKESKHIMLYYPTKYEINLLELICREKNFYLPRVKWNDLEVCPYSDKLLKSAFGIFEPVTAAVNPKILDLVIVPALMCDKKGYRLGYGGGFYDRFLKTVRCKTICAIPKSLFVESIPTDDFDVAVDKIFISR